MGTWLKQISKYLTCAVWRTGFPLIHSSSFIDVRIINEYSLLYEIRGTEGGSPYMLTGHMDVVPANEQTWSVDPFAGIIRDGVIYGRGAIDDKHSVLVTIAWLICISYHSVYGETFLELDYIRRLLINGFNFEECFKFRQVLHVFSVLITLRQKMFKLRVNLRFTLQRNLLKLWNDYVNRCRVRCYRFTHFLR